MERVDDIIIRYYKAWLEFSRLIDEKAKGDWSKADLLINNNGEPNKFLMKCMRHYLILNNQLLLGNCIKCPMILFLFVMKCYKN